MNINVEAIEHINTEFKKQARTFRKKSLYVIFCKTGFIWWALATIFIPLKYFAKKHHEKYLIIKRWYRMQMFYQQKIINETQKILDKYNCGIDLRNP